MLHLELQITITKLQAPTWCLMLHSQEQDVQYFLAEIAPRLETLRCFTQASFDASPAVDPRTENDLFYK